MSMLCTLEHLQVIIQAFSNSTFVNICKNKDDDENENRNEYNDDNDVW